MTTEDINESLKEVLSHLKSAERAALQYCAENSPSKEPDVEALIQAESQGYLRGLSDSKALALMRARDSEPKRKIVQLARLGDRTACVDNEGRAWDLQHKLGEGMVWVALPELPQGEI